MKSLCVLGSSSRFWVVDPTASLRPPGDIDNEDLMPRGLREEAEEEQTAT